MVEEANRNAHHGERTSATIWHVLEKSAADTKSDHV